MTRRHSNLGPTTPLYWDLPPPYTGIYHPLIPDPGRLGPVYRDPPMAKLEYTAKSWFTVPHTGLSAADIMGKLTQA